MPNVRVVGVEPKLGDRLQGLRSLAEGYVPPLLDLTFGIDTSGLSVLLDTSDACPDETVNLTVAGTFSSV